MHWWRLGLALTALGCGNRFVPSPFGSATGADAGVDAGTGLPDAGGELGGFGAPPNEVLGGPCVDDAQCDDGIECTVGLCDPILRACRFLAADERCGDGVYCNGIERCDPRIGCIAGPPTSCSDATPCTIDRCDEVSQSCVRVERDVDGDGDVDGNCRPGADCNDLDPRIASSAPEICSNQRDDDCDGQVDESGGCQLPEFDTCAAPLAIDAPGSYLLSPAGAALDYGGTCGTDGAAARELVLTITVPDADPRDLDLVARTAFGNLALASPSTCGTAPAAGECARGALRAGGEAVARLHLYSPPPGTHTVYLYTDANADIELELAEQAASIDTPNLSCETAAALEPGVPLDVDLAGTGLAGEGATLVESACPTDRGDRFFEFSIAATSDVRLLAESLDGLGDPRLSVRDGAECPLAPELRCNQRALAATRLRALPAGDYVVAVSASGPTRARLELDVRPPTEVPATDQCEAAPALVANVVEPLDFEDLDDDIAVGCSSGSLDTARRLDLAVASDVLLVGRFAQGDVGAVALSSPSCGESDAIACSRTSEGLSRVSQRGLPAGQYRVVVESLLGLPATVLAATRAVSVATFVPGSESCANAVTIDPAGGLYQGNTGNAAPNLSASCDFATPMGAPDQLLRLVLTAPRRVVFDMRGSDYDTLLNVRRGPECPGEEVPLGCAVFSGGDRSFLDLTLPAGDYFVQIDGYAGASGNWLLNVFAMDP